jgi:hypothetical protein
MNPKTIAIAALLAASSAAPAGAQTIVDMSLISCDQFLKSPQERKERLDGRLLQRHEEPRHDRRAVRGAQLKEDRKLL